MANTLLQAKTQTIWASSTSSKTSTFASSCTSGSLLIAVASHGAPGTPAADNWTVSDPTNGTWTKDVEARSQEGTVGAHGAAAVWSVANTATSALTVTLGSLNTTTDGSLKIYEFQGSGGGTLVFDSSGKKDTFPVSGVSFSWTRAANSTVVAGAVAYSSTLGTDTGFTVDGPTGGSTAYYSDEYEADAGSGGTQTINWGSASDPSSVYVSVGASYKLQGGTDTPLNPGVGSLTITGFAPTLTQTGGTNTALNPGVGSLSITGYAPTIAQSTGAIITNPLKNNTATPQSSLTGLTAVVMSTTGVLVVRKTAQTTDGSGIMTITDALIVPGTQYYVFMLNPSGGAAGHTNLITAGHT